VTRCGSFVLPFLALYLTQALGLSFAQAGMVCALYGVGLAVAGPLGGYLPTGSAVASCSWRRSGSAVPA
jgi:hypothetical protein